MHRAFPRDAAVMERHPDLLGEGRRRSVEASMPGLTHVAGTRQPHLSFEEKSFYKAAMAAEMVIPQHTSARPELPAPPSQMAAAWGDLLDGSRKTWMWSAMAMQDIKLRYRGSVLGPFWLTISTVIMVAAIGLIYARLFN